MFALPAFSLVIKACGLLKLGQTGEKRGEGGIKEVSGGQLMGAGRWGQFQFHTKLTHCQGAHNRQV